MRTSVSSDAILDTPASSQTVKLSTILWPETALLLPVPQAWVQTSMLVRGEWSVSNLGLTASGNKLYSKCLSSGRDGKTVGYIIKGVKARKACFWIETTIICQLHGSKNFKKQIHDKTSSNGHGHLALQKVLFQQDQH